MPGRSQHNFASWFIRRIGLARATTFAGVAGLALAPLTGARPTAAALGLALALSGVLGGLALSSRSAAPARRGPLLIALLVLTTGVFAGYLLGSVRVMVLSDSDLVGHPGKVIEAELVVTGHARVSNRGWQSAAAKVRGPAPGHTRSGSAALATAARGESVLLEVAPAAGGTRSVLAQGLVVNVQGEIEFPREASASGFDQAAYLRHQGIFVVLKARNEDVVVVGRRDGVSGWFDRVRSSARAHLSRGPDARLDKVLNGVVMGETVGMDQEWNEAFRRAGTAHMFSVSGLHVASIAALVIGLARLVRASRGVGFVLAVSAAFLMIPFVGSSPPLVRAAVMIAIVLAGSWTGRRKDPWQVLALAALVVLGLNPFAVSDPGFQLSFAAIAGIFALAAPLQRWMKALPKILGSNLAISIGASLGTAPVSLLVFDRTSLVAPLANLLVVPLLPIITGLGMASVFGGFLWIGLSSAFDTLASVPLAWTVEVSRLLAIAPVLDADDAGRAILAAGCAAGAAPAALALMGRAVTTPFGVPAPCFRRSIRWLRIHRPRRRGPATLLGAVLILTALVLGGAVYSPVVRGVETLATIAAGNRWPDQVEIRVLDVGQGQAVLVRTPARHALLFDGGPAGCDLARQLRALGVRTLDVVVISHPHADHFAGLLEALDGLEVRTLVDRTVVLTRGPPAGGPGRLLPAVPEGTDGWVAAKTREAGDYLELRRQIAERGGRHVLVGRGSSMTLERMEVSFFAPSRPLVMTDGPEPWAARSGTPTGDELNSGSLVAVLSVDGVEILLAGDAEADALGPYSLPQVEIIVVPHHGSKDSVSVDLLRRLQVEAACISVGEDNSFGHPDPSTLSALMGAVGSVLRTDEVGWVSYTVGGGRAASATEREPKQ